MGEKNCLRLFNKGCAAAALLQTAEQTEVVDWLRVWGLEVSDSPALCHDNNVSGRTFSCYEGGLHAGLRFTLS